MATPPRIMAETEPHMTRVKAGGPPPIQLHRVTHIETASVDDEPGMPIDVAKPDGPTWVDDLLLAGLFCACSMGIGYIIGRYFA